MRPILQTGLWSPPPDINRSPHPVSQRTGYFPFPKCLFISKSGSESSHTSLIPTLKRYSLLTWAALIPPSPPTQQAFLSYLSFFAFFFLQTKIPLKYLNTPTVVSWDAAPSSLQTELLDPKIVFQAEKGKLRKIKIFFSSCFLLNRSIEISRITVPPSMQQAESPCVQIKNLPFGWAQMGTLQLF